MPDFPVDVDVVHVDERSIKMRGIIIHVEKCQYHKICEHTYFDNPNFTTSRK